MKAENRQKKHCLYRHYDAAGKLLYVGVTVAPDRRLRSHKKSSWYARIAHVALQWIATRSEALAAEEAAIKAEKPAHNGTYRRLVLEEEHEVIVLLYNGNLSSGELARLYGISPQQVCNILHKRGVAVRRGW